MDWYGKGFKLMMKDAASSTGLSEDEVTLLYSFFSGIGLIDYDVEKEVIYENYCDEDGVPYEE